MAFDVVIAGGLALDVVRMGSFGAQASSSRTRRDDTWQCSCGHPPSGLIGRVPGEAPQVLKSHASRNSGIHASRGRDSLSLFEDVVDLELILGAHTMSQVLRFLLGRPVERPFPSPMDWEAHHRRLRKFQHGSRTGSGIRLCLEMLLGVGKTLSRVKGLITKDQHWIAES